jgi:D-glycero-alpha-D-manno-heptose 1-phosphate guanylyltransferase
MTLSVAETPAVVLVGGLGTRIRHLVPDLPKPLVPVAGRPFLEWVLRYLAGQGTRRVILASGYAHAKLEAFAAAGAVAGLEVSCVVEPRPLGTAGAFRHAARTAGLHPAQWLVLNGDSLALTDLAPLFTALTDAGIEGALLGLPVTDAARFGTLTRNAAGELIGFAEKRPGAGVINAGVYLLRARALDGWPVHESLSFEREVFPGLTSRSARLKVCVHAAPFLDIGTPESLAEADRFVQAHPDWFLRV